MKYLFLLLFPLLCFSQWKEEIVTDSIIKETYPIVYNNNLSIKKYNNNLIMNIQVESEKYIRDGHLYLDLLFISDTIPDYNTHTNCICYNKLIICGQISRQPYFNQFYKYDSLIIHLRNYKTIHYSYNIKNFKKYELFLINN